MKTLNAHFQVRYLPENRQTVKRRATKCKFVILSVFILLPTKLYIVLQSCIFFSTTSMGYRVFLNFDKMFFFS